MSKNRFELFFLDQNYWEQISSVWYHLLENKKSENFSRPYFGPFKIDLYKNVEFYVPLSTKWYRNDNGDAILDEKGKYIVKKDSCSSMFVKNNQGEYRAIIHFNNMVIVPTNGNFLTKINIKEQKNERSKKLLHVEEKFINGKNNLDEIKNKFSLQVKMYLNSRNYNIKTKFMELLEWADNYDSLPFPQNPQGCPTREQYMSKQSSSAIPFLVIYFGILIFIGIVLAIVLPLVIN